MKYKVTVKALYYDELEVEADYPEDAYKTAIKQFQPCADSLFSIDVFGLDPWTLGREDGDPHAEDRYMDERAGI